MTPLHPADFLTRDYGPLPGWTRVIEPTQDGLLVTYYPVARADAWRRV